MHGHKRPARGALFSVELLLVLPIALVLLFGLIEFGFLMTAKQRVEAASREAARVAALGGDERAVARAAKIALGPKLAQNAVVKTNLHDDESGRGRERDRERVVVCVAVPSKCAAPDLLSFVGISLRGQRLEAAAAMRRE
jgi:Flp pilus assembly protein TadG